MVGSTQVQLQYSYSYSNWDGFGGRLMRYLEQNLHSPKRDQEVRKLYMLRCKLPCPQLSSPASAHLTQGSMSRQSETMSAHLWQHTRRYQKCSHERLRTPLPLLTNDVFDAGQYVSMRPCRRPQPMKHYHALCARCTLLLCTHRAVCLVKVRPCLHSSGNRRAATRGR